MLSKHLPLIFLTIVGFLACKSVQLVQQIEIERQKEIAAEKVASKKNIRNEIADFADNFLKTRYKYAGTSPKTGFDCSGFTSYVLDEFEVKVPRSSAAQSEQGIKKSLADAKKGDLVFFRKTKKGRVFHVAMIYEHSPKGVEIIHCTSSRGVVIDDLEGSKYWMPKVSHVRDVVGNNTP